MQQTNPGQSTGILAVGDLPIGFPAATIQQGIIAAGASSASVWTPSATTLRFRLMGWEVAYTSNATLATAAIITVSLRDGSTTIVSWPVFIPATAISGDGIQLVSRVEHLPSAGYVSVAQNNTLSLVLSSPVVGGSFQCVAWGLESP